MIQVINILVITFLILPLNKNSEYKYVGVKKCSPCHRGEDKGFQFEIWQKSKHSKAFKTLSSSKATKIVKEKGLKKPATEASECLECHIIVTDMKLKSDGVQCESCHGAGSAYRKISIMENRTKAILAGMVFYKNDAAIEKQCKTCHNERSPTYKEFKFKDMWLKIKHPIP
jgi:hypothetical protein